MAMRPWFSAPTTDAGRAVGRPPTDGDCCNRRRPPAPCWPTPRWPRRGIRAPTLLLATALLALAACTGGDRGEHGIEVPPAIAASDQTTAGIAAPARLGLCASCHGRDGIAIAADAPDLAGRDRNQLLDAMQAYLDGRRDHGPMRAMLGPIRPEERELLADWFAAQAPAADTAGTATADGMP